MATILSRSGWVTGELHVSKNRATAEFLEHGHEFLSLTNARIEASMDEIPFFALHRSAILLIMVDSNEGSRPPSRSSVLEDEHPLFFLLDVGTVRGLLSVPTNLRLSDFLVNPRHYFLVRQARLKVRDPWSQVTSEQAQPCVFLSVDAIVGISERLERRPRAPSIHPQSVLPRRPSSITGR